MTEQATATEIGMEQVTKEKLMADLRAVIADAEELLRATANQTGERITAARAKAEESLKAAKARLLEEQAAMMAKTKAAAKAADEYVRAHPWQAAGIAAVVGLVVGILAAQIVNWLLADKVPDGATAEMIRQSWNGQYGWRWMFTAVAVPSVIFFFASLFIPESPRWLARSGDDRRARRVLARIGGEAHAERELTDIQSSLAAEAQAGPAWQELLSPGIAGTLVMGIALAVLQQWAGINVIFNYAEEVYRNAGYGVNGILFNIVITGTVNLIFTLIALGLVDWFGRRTLMLFGCAGIALSHTVLGFTYRAGIKGLPIVLLTLSAIGFYALSLAPVTWVLISEIFPNRVRGAAVSVAVSALWIASFLLAFTFPMLNRALGSSGAFWAYAGVCLLGLLFVFWRVPETKGKTLEQIEQELIHVPRRAGNQP